MWTWDITYLRSSKYTGRFYYAYVIVDVYSRMVVSARVFEADNGICQDTSKKLVRSLFIPEEPQQGLCPYASLPQDIFLT